ncbi:MAG: hypothetical protein ACI9MC_003788 [Kiritimatiellia bacterium]|jgi:hypothetical protein
MRAQYLFALIALLACPGKKAPVPYVGDVPLVSESYRYASMHGMLESVQGARDALIRGKLDETKEHLAVATASTPLDLRGDAEAWMDRIREAAYSGVRADRSIELGEAVAGV